MSFRNTFQALIKLRHVIPSVGVKTVQKIRPVYNNIRIKHPCISKRNVIIALSILKWLGFESEDEDKESELIMTLKRSVLCMQREQYEKAEQMLHLALRIAQQQQNTQGVVYCYDLMANLAMDQYQLEKAEKLFVSVMQMLLAAGTQQDDIKMIHLSLKMARINHLLARYETADLGYKWCLEKIAAKKTQDYDALVLYGVVQDWYAQFLLDTKQLDESLVHLREAYRICEQVKGRNTEQGMLLLNDLGITSWRAGDLQKAEEFLKEALKSSEQVEDKSHVGVIHANLGLIYLQNGLIEDARKFCKNGWQIGKKYDNKESVEQSNYCLDQINLMLQTK